MGEDKQEGVIVEDKPQEAVTEPIEAKEGEVKAESPDVLKKLEELTHRVTTSEEKRKEDQRAMSRKDQENTLLKSQIEDSQAIIKALAMERADPEDGQPRTKDTVNEILKSQETRRYQAEGVQKGNEIKNRVEALGLTDDDVEYWDIERDVRSSDFDLANAKLKRLEKAKLPKEADKPKETEAELRERIKREVYEESKLLTPEGSHSAESNKSGRKPTLEEVKAVSPLVYDDKIKSGEWVI